MVFGKIDLKGFNDHRVDFYSWNASLVRIIGASLQFTWNTIRILFSFWRKKAKGNLALVSYRIPSLVLVSLFSFQLSWIQIQLKGVNIKVDRDRLRVWRRLKHQTPFKWWISRQNNCLWQVKSTYFPTHPINGNLRNLPTFNEFIYKGLFFY